MVSSIMTKLRERVEAKLREDSRLKEYPVEVLDNNGVITLQGVVPSQALSMAAESLARQVDGVVNVINELDVEDRTRREGVNPPFPGVPPTQR
jgi:osmotically-inducible protein OsmY